MTNTELPRSATVLSFVPVDTDDFIGCRRDVLQCYAELRLHHVQRIPLAHGGCGAVEQVTLEDHGGNEPASEIGRERYLKNEGNLTSITERRDGGYRAPYPSTRSINVSVVNIHRQNIQQ